jgi:hypothetical protein
LAAVLVLAAIAAAGLVARAPDARPNANPAPRFVEEAIPAGVSHSYDGDFTYFVGGGVAVLDCDADARPDLYFAGGDAPAALFRNVSQVGGPLAFERAASATTDLPAVTGAYPLDVDGDGLHDLAVLRIGEDLLLRGTGDCTFEPANDSWGLDGGQAWTTAFSATWEAERTLPTLAFGNYLILDAEGESTFTCDDNALVRPSSDGRYAEPMVLAPSWCALSLLFSDWDRSGRRDLRVSNDRHYYRDGSEQLWRIEPGAAPALYTADAGWQTLRIWGMGIASRDLTGDGYPEVYLTSQGDNKLQTLVGGAGRPEYADIALQRGATAHRPYTGDTTLASTAWHPEFDDVNNDGLVDLFVSKGNVEAQVDYAARDPSNLLLGQRDGTFVEAAPEAGMVSYARARGAALADLNLDGLLDLVVVNRRENVALWRNVGTGDAGQPEPLGAWLAVELRQPGANRDAIGAWVEVRVGRRSWLVERTVGGGHASGQLGPIHVGLGDTERAEVRVTWPDGDVGGWYAVETNGFVIIDRDAGEPVRRTAEEMVAP